MAGLTNALSPLSIVSLLDLVSCILPNFSFPPGSECTMFLCRTLDHGWHSKPRMSLAVRLINDCGLGGRLNFITIKLQCLIVDCSEMRRRSRQEKVFIIVLENVSLGALHKYAHMPFTNGEVRKR